MNALELSPEARKATETIQKLLNLAAKAGTPEEAASATAKAQELLAKFNLSAEFVEREGGAAEGKREQSEVDGGFYAFQRELWRAVAELNFCLYWAQRYYAKGRRQIREEVWDEERRCYRRKVVGQFQVDDRIKTRHVVVGKIVNVRSTIAMARYLSAAIERITRERLDDQSRLSNWAMSFRRGAVRSVANKLAEARAIVLDEEEKRAADVERARTAGASASTVLTVARLTETERDANLDFVHGEGWSARRAAVRAEAARERAEQEAAYAQWAAANPEEVAARRAEAEKREAANAKRRKGRVSYGRNDGIDWGAFRAGRAAGEKIGLAPQVDSGNATKIGRTS